MIRPIMRMSSSILSFFYHCCHDIFTHSFGQDSDSPIDDLSMPPVFDDPCFDEVETPQDVEALQPKLIIISGSHSLEASSTYN